MIRFKKLRKNGGLIWHWVHMDGSNRGEALCGATINRRQRRSYWWTQKSGLIASEDRMCHRCQDKRLMMQHKKYVFEKD